LKLQGIKQKFGILGNSEGLENALSTAVRVAATELTVLITGESGVGKEVFSKVIHSLSIRKHNPFIAINCGAIPEGTINSELFGHEKGSFTGAIGERKGYFETVNGGTIFLDEIGELPLDTQALLLRVLESGEYIRVGASKIHKTDVRVIAATNVHLESLVKKGRFREDLYFRLNIVPIRVPPLRERREDIKILFRRFALDFSEKYNTPGIQLDEQALRFLENYSWPGNIRELRNVTEQLSVMCDQQVLTIEEIMRIAPQLAKRNLPSIIRADDTEQNLSDRDILYKLLYDMKSDMHDLKSLVFELINSNQLVVRDTSALKHLSSYTRQSEPIYPASFNSTIAAQTSFLPTSPELSHQDALSPVFLQDNDLEDFELMHEIPEILSIEDMEKEMITKSLKKFKGRRKEAARELGLSERTLYRKIKQYEL